MRDTDSSLEEDGFELAVPREGKGYGEPLQASIAVSGLNLSVALPFVPPSPIGNSQKSLSQERDRWFESGSLQR